MNLTLFIVPLGAVAMMVLLLVWAFRPGKSHGTGTPHIGAEEPARQHATYFGVIRQAMSEEDFAFLAARAPSRSARRAYEERRHIALLYLADLRADFRRLLRLAKIITVLSPEVAASSELERLRLSFLFFWRYNMVLLALYAGLLPPHLTTLSQMVSQLSFRVESAMNDLGERAAVAAELASTLNRRGLDVA